MAPETPGRLNDDKKSGRHPVYVPPLDPTAWRKLATLIDADNLAPAITAEMPQEIAWIWAASTRRIYGDLHRHHAPKNGKKRTRAAVEKRELHRQESC